jgi:hypothetical protein
LLANFLPEEKCDRMAGNNVIICYFKYTICAFKRPKISTNYLFAIAYHAGEILNTPFAITNHAVEILNTPFAIVNHVAEILNTPFAI